MDSNKNWYPHIIVYFWIAIGISSAVTLVNLIFTKMDAHAYLMECFLLPLLIEISIVLILKRMIRSNSNATAYYIVIGIQTMVAILIVIHYPVFKVMLPLFMLPVLLSVFFSISPLFVLPLFRRWPCLWDCAFGFRLFR